MVNGDFGALLFRDILRFTQYPGAPFTGDILQDMVNYFLFPTVFIILFIYVILGVLFTKAQAKFRLLVGITLYLVIIVNGWYGTFALFGQFYILFLLLLGVFYFLLTHFGIRIGGGGGGGKVPGTGEGTEKQLKLLKSRREKLDDDISALEARLAAAIQAGKFEEAEKIRREINRKIEERDRWSLVNR